jgi:hypothetical protein
MRRYLFVGCLALLFGCSWTQDIAAAQDIEMVDSAVAPERPATPAAQLIAPQAKPVRIQLPATIRPLKQNSSEPQPDKQQVGYLEPFDPNWVPQHQPLVLPDGGRVWRYELHSADAVGLRCQMWGNPTQAQLEIRFYDPRSGYVLPPIVSPILDEEGIWWGPTIWGDTLGIEIYQPSGTSSEFPIAIVGIVYLFCSANCGTPGGGTGFNCHNDITCFPAWKNSFEDNAVGKYFFVSGSVCFTCTGTMVNRQPGDFSPLFITAQHCMGTQSETHSMEIFWEYETATCNGTPADPYTLPRNSGALLLKRYQDADTILVGLYDPPGVNAYVGWSTTSPVGESIAGVHHPASSFKRISFGTVVGQEENSRFRDIPYTVDTWVTNYTSGTIEGGSSGSALYGADRRLRGVLTGGFLGCPPATVLGYYGRFSDATTNLRYYLINTDIASPVFVNRAVSGDPENGGNSERGTAANPFNTVYEATFAVRANDTVRIVPGNYNERFRVWRPMRLEREGTSGVVRIGAP